MDMQQCGYLGRQGWVEVKEGIREIYGNGKKSTIKIILERLANPDEDR